MDECRTDIILLQRIINYQEDRTNEMVDGLQTEIEMNKETIDHLQSRIVQLENMLLTIINGKPK
jgi:peptidoglycan hydrolase CwlO-like protein